MIDIKAIREAADRAAHGLDHTDQIHWRVLIGPKEVIALCDEIERLRFANRDLSDWFEAAKTDAVRYEWLRNNACHHPAKVAVMIGSLIYPEQFDAAIDAAMESK